MKVTVKKSTFYLILSFLPVSMLVVYGISQVLAAYSSKENFKNLLMLDSESVNDYYQPSITWEQPFRNKGRLMDMASLPKVSNDYTASFYHQFQALKTGEIAGLNDYYTRKSRAQLIKLTDWHVENNITTEGTTLSHHARLDFFSADGTILNLTDRCISYQVQKMNDQVINRFYDTSSFKVMMLLEDNFWRIRQKVRVPSQRKVGLPQRDAGKFPTDFRIKGINYYPQLHPWQAMWAHFDAVDFRADFQLIDSLGFNTIRIFIPFHHFGGEQVKAGELEKLIELLDLASQYELKVIATLFDFFLGYRVEEWTLSDRHLEAIIKAIGKHPALLAFDLKNEPNLDFERAGKDEVLAWLDFISRRLSGYDAALCQTVGWSQPEYAHLMMDQLDFVSFHFYRDIPELTSYLDSVSLQKPLFMGEAGRHTFDAWWYPFGNEEKDQLAYYRELMHEIETSNLHYAFWTLYDFAKIPSNVAGKWPWQKGPQKAYGLIRHDREKETLQLVRNFNHHLDEE